MAILTLAWANGKDSYTYQPIYNYNQKNTPMIFEVSKETYAILKKKELPHSLEWLAQWDFKASENLDKTKVDNNLFVEFKRCFGFVSIIVTYMFDMDNKGDLVETTVEMQIGEEFAPLQFKNKLDLYNFVYTVSLAAA